MAENNVQFNLLKTKELNTSSTSQSEFSQTIPEIQCENGFPKDKYARYFSSNPVEVLYSSWCSYQNTLGAQFTYQQSFYNAPNNLDNPPIGPANIFIIRHGEKPKFQMPLNNNGIYRASQITTFVNQLAKDGYPISYIVTCNPCPFNTLGQSMRPEQTISLSSFMLNIPFFIYGASSETEITAEKIFSSEPNNQFNGLNILICWEHTKIQDLTIHLLDNAQIVGRSDLLGKQYFEELHLNNKSPCYDGNYEAITDVPNGANNDYVTNELLYKYIPYWNDDNYNHVYWLKGNAEFTNFEFYLFDQPCLTCYKSCNLAICLYQPTTTPCTTSNNYYNNENLDIETKCLNPTDWLVQ